MQQIVQERLRQQHRLPPPPPPGQRRPMRPARASDRRVPGQPGIRQGLVSRIEARRPPRLPDTRPWTRPGTRRRPRRPERSAPAAASTRRRSHAAIRTSGGKEARLSVCSASAEAEAAARIPQGHADRRPDGQGSGRKARRPNEGHDQEADGSRRLRDDQSDARQGNGQGNREGLQRRSRIRDVRRKRHARCRRSQRRRESAAARAGRHDHGPRRSRKDVAARCDSQDPRHRTGSRRNHAAHRRLSGEGQGPEDHVPRHAGSRSVHADARARRASHRHRRSGRRRRRRRHAADHRIDFAHEGRQGSVRRRDQQDRQTRRQSRTRQTRTGRTGPAGRRLGRRYRHR